MVGWGSQGRRLLARAARDNLAAPLRLRKLRRGRALLCRLRRRQPLWRTALLTRTLSRAGRCGQGVRGTMAVEAVETVAAPAWSGLLGLLPLPNSGPCSEIRRTRPRTEEVSSLSRPCETHAASGKKGGRARAVLNRPQTLGWSTSYAHEIALRQWRGRTEITQARGAGAGVPGVRVRSCRCRRHCEF